MKKHQLIPHQTVGWWIEELKAFDPKLPVVLLAGADDPMFMLSIYESEINRKIVFIDVGRE